MATTSSACRCTSDSATGSPAAATANSTGVSSWRRACGTRPRCIASISEAIDAWPRYAGRARASSVGPPRPSSARAANHRASSASPPPPPQSPEIRPTAGKRAVRPSGVIPTQLMPAPHTTATPHGSAPVGSPERSSAKVSLCTAVARPQPRRSISRASSRSSTAKSALARHADTRSAHGPAAGSARSPASAIASASTSTAAATPVRGGWKPPAWPEHSTEPSGARRATSVLLLPASIASTEGRVTPMAGAPCCARGAGRSALRPGRTAR